MAYVGARYGECLRAEEGAWVEARPHCSPPENLPDMSLGEGRSPKQLINTHVKLDVYPFSCKPHDCQKSN